MAERKNPWDDPVIRAAREKGLREYQGRVKAAFDLVPRLQVENELLKQLLEKERRSPND